MRRRLGYDRAMRKADAIALLLAHTGPLQAVGVAHVSLFGSVARDQTCPESDIDLVIDGPPDRPVTLFTMARAQALLEEIFSRRVDLTAQEDLDHAPRLRARIGDDLTPVF